MFKVTIIEQRITAGKPDTYRESIIAKNEDHLARIRRNAQEQATTGGSQVIKVKRI